LADLATAISSNAISPAFHQKWMSRRGAVVSPAVPVVVAGRQLVQRAEALDDV